MSVASTERRIDALVAQIDPHAVYRTETKARGRSVDVTIEDGSGMATVFATLYAHDATAFDARVSALADTVCPADPRTTDQRRADAIGALAHGADRLACLCDQEDCPAALAPPSTGVVVYVIAHQDTLDRTGGPAGLPRHSLAGRHTVGRSTNRRSPSPTTPQTVPRHPRSLPPTTPTSDPDRRHRLYAHRRVRQPRRRPAPRFAKPLHELTLTEALTPPPGRLAMHPARRDHGRPTAPRGDRRVQPHRALPPTTARNALHGLSG